METRLVLPGPERRRLRLVHNEQDEGGCDKDEMPARQARSATLLTPLRQFLKTSDLICNVMGRPCRVGAGEWHAEFHNQKQQMFCLLRRMG